jgi:hypothetical protein
MKISIFGSQDILLTKIKYKCLIKPYFSLFPIESDNIEIKSKQLQARNIPLSHHKHCHVAWNQKLKLCKHVQFQVEEDQCDAKLTHPSNCLTPIYSHQVHLIHFIEMISHHVLMGLALP